MNDKSANEAERRLEHVVRRESALLRFRQGLDDAMVEAGLDRAALADRIGCGEPTLAMTLADADRLTITNLAVIASALGRDLSVSFASPTPGGAG